MHPLVIAAFAGKGLTAYGKWSAAQTQAEGYAYEAGMATLAAKETKQQADYEAWRMDLGLRRTLGTQVAGFAAAVELSGTAIDVLAKTAEMLTLDKIWMRRTAGIAARQHMMDAAMYKKAAKSARRRGVIEAIGSFLG